MIAQHLIGILRLEHVARLHPGDAVGERHPGAGDRGRAGAAVGLDHVAIDGDLAFAERGEIDHRTQGASDQPLDFHRAAALLAGRSLAAGAFGSGARQHAVFGGDPAAPLALEPGRQPLFQAGGHQHMGVAELHETGAFGVFDHAAFERDRAQFVDLSAARPHRALSWLRMAHDLFRKPVPTFRDHALGLGAHHNHMHGLNKSGAMPIVAGRKE